MFLYQCQKVSILKWTMISDSLFCTAKFATDLKSRKPLLQHIQSITYLMLQTVSSKRLKKDILIDLYVLFLSPITGSVIIL